MGLERDRLEQLRRWKQTAIWAPVVWFPVVVYAMLTGETLMALALGFAGVVFAGLARGVVWLGRCPRCDARFRDSASAFRKVWHASSCEACGLSLFELRRGSQSEASRDESAGTRADG